MKKRYEMTKREAWLLVHVVENYPCGCDEETLAASLLWPVSKVCATLETLAVFGLMSGPVVIPTDGVVVVPIGRNVAVRDLLTRAEVRKAKRRHDSAVE